MACETFHIVDSKQALVNTFLGQSLSFPREAGNARAKQPRDLRQLGEFGQLKRRREEERKLNNHCAACALGERSEHEERSKRNSHRFS